MRVSEEKKLTDNFEKCQKLRKIKFLIFHHIEAEDINSAIDLLNENKVSAHYIIDVNGDVYNLVSDCDIAFHAGYSNFRGIESINKVSIGIELLNHNVAENEFPFTQLDSLLELSKKLIQKYNINQKNILGHSDIAYYPESTKYKDQIGFLDRKQDPSHLFNWKYMAQNGVSIFPEVGIKIDDKTLFSHGDVDSEIVRVKADLKRYGYKVTNSGQHFDIEMKNLCRVFNRRYNPHKFNSDPDSWWLSSDEILKSLIV
tara:strand:+ start:38 stop:808 length:771 start_codon:yes stop_codon:yes gene_type:complete